MSKLAESLKRLYNRGMVTKAKIDSMLSAGTITQAEHDYILGVE